MNFKISLWTLTLLFTATAILLLLLGVCLPNC